NGSTTAHGPGRSSAPRSQVTSSRPVNRRPPTTARSAGVPIEAEPTMRPSDLFAQCHTRVWHCANKSGEHAGMDFELTPEQDAFRKVVRDFAESEIAPHAEDWDRDHVFPVDTVLAMGRLGLFGL